MVQKSYKTFTIAFFYTYTSTTATIKEKIRSIIDLMTKLGLLLLL